MPTYHSLTSTPYLLMDFGTSSLKTAVVDLESGLFSHAMSYPSLTDVITPSGRYEVSPEALHNRFLFICDTYRNRLGIPFRGIVLCSEQNGVILLDEHDRPLTNYISWKDERSLEAIDGVSTYALIMDRLGRDFLRITGTRPGPNLPLMAVAHLGRLGMLPGHVRLATLPEWLDLCSGDSRHVVHDTMLHCLSFYDVRQGQISRDLTQFVESLTGTSCTFNAVAPTGTVSGYWHGDGEAIPIFVGVGDHPCCVLGACNEPRRTISLNLGTSSQVSIIDGDPTFDQCETRPYFDGLRMAAMTRVAAGRGLANFVGLLEEAVKASGGEADFWAMLRDLDAAEIIAGTLHFDLALFGSAWDYRGGGAIFGITDGALTLKNYFASLLKSLAAQYGELIRLFDPDRRAHACILSGGLARRLPHLREVLDRTTGYTIEPACQVDESFLGLRTLALVADGRARTCLEGQEVFGRAARVV